MGKVATKIIKTKVAKQAHNTSKINTSLVPKLFTPIGKRQQTVFDEYRNSDNNLFLMGCAGTGKTFISMYLGFDEMLTDDSCPYEKVIIVRSAVQSRDIGFMPGNQKEKAEVYEDPYRGICDDIFGRGDAYEILKKKDMIEFMLTSFVRGRTINNALVIIDECQNMNYGEIDSVITRIGLNCRLIICGDMRQNDLQNTREKSGMNDVLKIIDNMNSFTKVEFQLEDIVRSGFVKEYLTMKENLISDGIIERY